MPRTLILSKRKYSLPVNTGQVVTGDQIFSFFSIRSAALELR